MKNKLPVYIDNLELPIDELKKPETNNHSYGFVSILFLLSTMITLASLLALLIFKN